MDSWQHVRLIAEPALAVACSTSYRGPYAPFRVVSQLEGLVVSRGSREQAYKAGERINDESGF